LRFLVNIALVLAVFMLAEGVAQTYYKPPPPRKISGNPAIFWGTNSAMFTLPAKNPFVRKKPGQLKIVCFGDSNVAGTPGPMSEAWPARMEAVLKKQGVDVVVHNAGCPGFTTWQTVEVYARYCDKFQPDDDLILVHCLFNDAMLEMATDRQRQRMLEESRAAREGLNRFALYKWLRSKLLPPVEIGKGRVPRVPPDEFMENLAAMRMRAKIAGANLVYISFPATRPEGLTYKAQLTEWSVPKIDLSTDGKISRHLVSDGVHFDRQGHEIIGRRLAELVKNNYLKGQNR